MERRKSSRFARRLQVRFWRHGDSTVYSGYTTNISTTGMFVGTASPVRPGSRVRVEVLDEENGFVVEGVVAHSARVSPLLQKLKTSGMGVRFLGVAELVGALMPSSRPQPPESEEENVEPPEPEQVPEPEEIEASEEPVERAPAAAAPEVREVGDTYPVEFPSLPTFLAVLDRDIENGGVFVPTSAPAELHGRVTVELLIPPPIDRRVRAGATVVHIVEAHEAVGGEENLLAGMAVEFSDPERVVAQVHSLIYPS